MISVIQYCLYPIILVLLAIPLGKYMKKVMYGEKTFLSKVLNPVESFIYRIAGIDRERKWDGRDTFFQYCSSLL